MNLQVFPCNPSYVYCSGTSQVLSCEIGASAIGATQRVQVPTILILLMIYILHYLKDPKLWELIMVYVPSYGQCWIYIINRSLHTHKGVLGGSWVVLIGAISPLIWATTIVTLLITPLRTTPKPQKTLENPFEGTIFGGLITPIL